jgi:hypothetical protein
MDDYKTIDKVIAYERESIPVKCLDKRDLKTDTNDANNNTITNNYFHDCWANSYDYTYDGGAVEFYGSGSSNNFIGYNTFYDCNGVVENGSGNGGTINNNKFVYNKNSSGWGLFFFFGSFEHFYSWRFREVCLQIHRQFYF